MRIKYALVFIEVLTFTKLAVSSSAQSWLNLTLLLLCVPLIMLVPVSATNFLVLTVRTVLI